MKERLLRHIRPTLFYNTKTEIQDFTLRQSKRAKFLFRLPPREHLMISVRHMEEQIVLPIAQRLSVSTLLMGETEGEKEKGASEWFFQVWTRAEWYIAGVWITINDIFVDIYGHPVPGRH